MVAATDLWWHCVQTGVEPTFQGHKSIAVCDIASVEATKSETLVFCSTATLILTIQYAQFVHCFLG